MDQKKLYKTVEEIASQKFPSEKEMLFSVVSQLVDNEDVLFKGGRVWKLNKDSADYTILFQTGDVGKIKPDFSLSISDYPIFELISKERTIVDSETNMILKSKGILNYSATGIGDKIKIDNTAYFEYLLALNSNVINEEQKAALNIIATAITSQIKQKRYSQRAKLLKADLDKARELQKSILPEHEYRFYHYEVFGITVPAEIVGGDFFDYLEIGDDENRLAVVIGDAASKGVSAAAEAMYIAGALRMASSFEIKIYPLMKRMNQLVNKIFADDKFASLFYGELSHDKSGLFLYANAGHNPPIFLRQNSDAVEFLHPTGPVLGPAPNAKYTVENVNFTVGDVLIIYSDGLTEAADVDFNEYGEDRLVNIAKQKKHLSPREITYAILDDIIKYSKNGLYSDDKTIVVIKRMQ
jgi:phosphoserine phosphatase RsbU/P